MKSRKFTHFTLSLVVAFAPVTGQCDLDRHYTPASMTREKYAEQIAKLSQLSSKQIIEEFDKAYSLTQAKERIQENFEKVKLKRIGMNTVQSLSDTWMAALVLAKQGFASQAEAKWDEGIMNAALWGQELVYDRKVSIETVDEAFALISEVTVAEMVMRFGYMKQFERDRISTFLRYTVKQMKSKEMQNKIRTAFGNQVINSFPWAALIALGFAVGGAGGLVGTGYNILDHRITNWIDANIGATPLVLMAAIAAGGAIGAIIGLAVPHSIGEFVADRRLSYPSLENIGSRCEQLLSSSGEILL